MPTTATLRPTATTDAAQVFTCRAARNFQITISVAAVFIAFAPESQGVPGSFGPEEFHAPETLIISNEPIGAISFRSALAGTPATIVISAGT